MRRNLKWIGELDLEYDSSTFDTDPFEPESDGVETVFPFRVDAGSDRPGYIELPYTLPQDSTLFIMLGETSSNIWKQKLDWVASCGGMVLLNSHPDYISFGGPGRKPGRYEYPVGFYREFLEYLRANYQGDFWHVLPKEMAIFWGSQDSIRDSASEGRGRKQHKEMYR